MTLTREQILGRKAGVREVQLEEGTVKVRGMTRGEAAGMRALPEDDVIGLEAYAIATCMIEPKLTIDEARSWLESEDTHQVQLVINAIENRSGHAEGQPKGFTKSVPRRGRSRN